MTSLFTRIGSGQNVRWTTVFGIILVPITIAGLFLWGLWNPQERFQDVTAAVVNNDDPVTIDGQVTPLGRVLASELIGADDDNFNWVLTDDDDAERGVASGEYVVAVTIPKNFSRAATSASQGPDKVEQARIDIDTSPRGKLLDTAISRAVTEAATRVLNEKLGTSFVDNIFVGLNQLGDGMREAASGAKQLATGGDQLASGAGQLADGTDQLASGTDQLASSTGQLVGGANELSGGASDLASGVDQYVGGVSGLASGADDLASGLGQLDSGLAESASGAAAAADGQQQLADGLAAYVDGVNSIAQPVEGALQPVQDRITQLKQDIENSALDAEQKETLLQLLDDASGKVTEAGAGVGELIQSGEQLKQGAQANAAGGRELADGLGQLSQGLHASSQGAQQLASGANQLAGSGSELSSGARQLADGSGELASGTQQLADGTRQLADQVPQLAEGARGLADGTKKSASGARDLSQGLAEGASQAPNYSKTEREKLAKTAVQPVTAQGESDRLFTDNGVPLFTSIALWAGGLAAFALIAPLWRRSRQAAKGVGTISLRSSLPGALLGAVQGLIAGIVLPLSLGYTGGQFWQFFGLALIAGVAFSLMNQGLVALLGGVGRFVAFVVLVAAFVVGVLSTVPGVLGAILQFTPVGAAFHGFQTVATGLSGIGSTVFVLVCWAALGLALIVFAVSRVRRPVAAGRSRR